MRIKAWVDEIHLDTAYIYGDYDAVPVVEIETNLESLVHEVGPWTPKVFDENELDEWTTLFEAIMEHNQLGRLLMDYMEELRQAKEGI